MNKIVFKEKENKYNERNKQRKKKIMMNLKSNDLDAFQFHNIQLNFGYDDRYELSALLRTSTDFKTKVNIVLKKKEGKNGALKRNEHQTFAKSIKTYERTVQENEFKNRKHFAKIRKKMDRNEMCCFYS